MSESQIKSYVYEHQNQSPEEVISQLNLQSVQDQNYVYEERWDIDFYSSVYGEY